MVVGWAPWWIGQTERTTFLTVGDRFSEDVDLTLNIQHLWPEVDLSPAVNPSQAANRRKTADRKLKQWVREIPLPLLQGAAAAAGVTLELDLEQPEAGRRQPPTIVIHYQPLIPAPDNSSGYVRPTVRLEFGAHSTGEPHGPMPINCEAATHLAMLDFPAARPLVMDARSLSQIPSRSSPFPSRSLGRERLS